MSEVPLAESGDVPCPNPKCVNGQVLTALLPADAFGPAEQVTEDCPVCNGKGEVPPVLLDPEFQSVIERGSRY